MNELEEIKREIEAELKVGSVSLTDRLLCIIAEALLKLASEK